MHWRCDRAQGIGQGKGPHLDPGTSSSYKQYIKNLVATGELRNLILMPTPNHGKMHNSAQSVRDAEKLSKETGGRIKTLCGADYLNRWMHKKRSVSKGQLSKRIKKLERQLAGGSCIGIGEFAIRHFEKWDGQLTGPIVPITSNGLQAVFALAESQSVVMDIHSEPMERNGKSWEKEWFSELSDIIDSYPGLTIILSHTGMTSVENVRKLINAYPKVLFNIKLVANPKKWSNLEPVNTKKLKKGLYEDWARLFEEHPERFMLGSDYKFGRKHHGKATDYDKLLDSYRKVLGSLHPDVAEQIAYKNAIRIFKF